MGDSFSQTRNVNAKTSTTKMLRFSLFCIALSTLNPYCFAAQVDARTARQYGQQQVNGQQQQQFAPQERQGFGGSVGVQTPFGGLDGSVNLGLPNANDNSLLTNSIIVLGVISLVNTVATVVIPFFTKKPDPPVVSTTDPPVTTTDPTPEGGAGAERSMRSLVSDETMKALEEAAIDGILKVKAKY